MVEVKCWNYKYGKQNTPGFDVANVTSYLNMINNDPEKLEADYFIFAYSHNPEDAMIKINNVFHRKIYEITGLDGKNRLKLQWKNSMAYNIRPVRFHIDGISPFNNYNDFLLKLRDVLKGSKQEDTMDLDEWYENIPQWYKDN